MMAQEQIDLAEINAKIQAIKETAMELQHMADQFPALNRNTVRLLSSIKMMELNVSDIADL
jgi:hypothetical protein